ncbi:MAG: helix-hairpin-helix domain-containing protein [Deltaproteobacteria bacterium]|nr:helix-hairpin-helix domain-containing protein [Deltaproteobacteria bacterium]MBW2042093.1 helix-hairpin-helix domain-containing protein [Deltaproteobacteria bacterium]MBW2132586.1 helix-hairpin-helix domain-containing protein [Deltaproteobacteria bacterium]
MTSRVLCVLLATVFAITVLMPASVLATDTEKVNINTASKEQLTTLKGIGPAIADRIIEHRNKTGPFEKPEDLQLVKGVGEKIYEINKDKIIVALPQQ